MKTFLSKYLFNKESFVAFTILLIGHIPTHALSVEIVQSTIYNKTGHAITNILPGGLNTAFTGVPVPHLIGADSADLILHDTEIPGLFQPVTIDVELNLLNERNVDPYTFNGELHNFFFTLNPTLQSFGKMTLVQTNLDDHGAGHEGFFMRETTINLIGTLVPINGGPSVEIPATIFVETPIPKPFSFDPIASNLIIKNGIVGDVTANWHDDKNSEQKNFFPFSGSLQVPLGGRSQFDAAGNFAKNGNHQSNLLTANGSGDFCLDDPNKLVPGLTGCGNSDIDSNGNGVPDFYESSLVLGGTVGGRQTALHYDANTGGVSLEVPSGVELISINLSSGSGIFTELSANNLGSFFDRDTDTSILKSTPGGTFGSIDFGKIAQQGLTEAFILEDVTARVMFSDLETYGGIDLEYIPQNASIDEPPSFILALMGIGLVVVIQRKKPTVLLGK